MTQTIQQDITTAKLFFNAAFPVMKVVLEDDPSMKAKFQNVQAIVQIGAFWEKAGGELLACHLVFDKGRFSVIQGTVESVGKKPDIALTFSSLAKMNTMFRGGLALPSIKGLGKLGLLLKVFSLLMSLMLMMPSSRPKDPAKQRLKVKMSLYMITRALSVYNKLGDPDMSEWCRRQPERIYQFIVDGEANGPPAVACYLRVKAGRSKSGHGVYTRRSPFVLFHFFSIGGALKVLLKDVAFVEGVEQGCVEIIGSPEYAMYLNDFMSILQGMLT
ncbi:MAG: hypothetical protein LBH75_05035 [Treponema sp.]|jgi:hypothetical protein|nr:hypothetical protein [Treponema sp.]